MAAQEANKSRKGAVEPAGKKGKSLNRRGKEIGSPFFV